MTFIELSKYINNKYDKTKNYYTRWMSMVKSMRYHHLGMRLVGRRLSLCTLAAVAADHEDNSCLPWNLPSWCWSFLLQRLLGLTKIQGFSVLVSYCWMLLWLCLHSYHVDSENNNMVQSWSWRTYSITCVTITNLSSLNAADLILV